MTRKAIAALACMALVVSCSQSVIPRPPGNPQAQYPAQVLDLSNWILTTPIPDNNGGVVEVRQPELRDYRSDLFRVSDDGAAVEFTTPADGSVQPGATAPRTELREVLPNGATAQWSTTEGRHRMLVTASLDEVPSTSEMEVIGQVHAIGPYVLLVQYTRGKLYVKAGDKNVGTLIEKYKLGTIFAYEMLVEDGTIRVIFNGQEKARYESDCGACYFKIGSYLQAPPEPAGSPHLGRVSVYSLKVVHD